VQSIDLCKVRLDKFWAQQDVDIERKQAQAIATLPDSITQLLCLP